MKRSKSTAHYGVCQTTVRTTTTVENCSTPQKLEQKYSFPVMNRRESKFGLKLRRWLKAHPLGYSATFELKDCSNKGTFNFKELKEHQINWSTAINSKRGILMRQLGGNGEPDYTYHYDEPAYIAINFKDGFEIITIAAILTEMATKKSLTHDRAREISIYSGC